ncbi:MAG TPA: helix-turn-helix domain-containing protein [Microlunatus sp.]|nr:helix-turn-helix domain-containing protein [Microlunatus sp.]
MSTAADETAATGTAVSGTAVSTTETDGGGADTVDRRRGYRSPRRLAAALETRARICAAARELFLADGYAATSIRAIASAAGVAEKTVYLQFATKSALLKMVVETAIVGDDEAVPAAGRSWFLETVAETDLDRKLDQLVALTCDLHQRSGSVFAVARGAAAVDPDVAALWAAGKQGHLADMTRMARSFEETGLLPPGRDLDWATTTLYVLLGPETWHLIRIELAQDDTAYRSWLSSQLRQAFSATPTKHAGT